MRAVCVVIAALCLAACVDPALRAQQQAAQKRALEDQLLAESPEGSRQQYEADLQAVKTLTPTQQDAFKDAGLGLPLTNDEKKAVMSMSPDQWRAIARQSKFVEWGKQKQTDLAAEPERERLIRAQEAQARASLRQAQASERAARAAALSASRPQHLSCSSFTTLGGMTTTNCN